MLLSELQGSIVDLQSTSLTELGKKHTLTSGLKKLDALSKKLTTHVKKAKKTKKRG